MALQPTTVDLAEVTRLDELKVQAFGQEMWSRAQQMESAYVRHVTNKDIGAASFKAFPRRNKRKFTRKTDAVVDTPHAKQTYDRRCLATEVYHDGILIDLDDIVDSQGDVFSDVVAEQRHAMARLADEVILSSLSGPVIVETKSTSRALLPHGNDLTSAAGENELLSFAANIEKRYQYNLFTLKTPGSERGQLIGGMTAGDNGGNDLQKVIRILRKRHIVMANIVGNLTPDLEFALKTDTAFQNAFNTYHAGTDSKLPFSGFTYRGIKFVPCSDEVLPPISRENFGIVATGAANAEVKAEAERTVVIARNLGKAGVGDIPRYRDDAAAGSTISESTVNSTAAINAAGKASGAKTVGGGGAASTATEMSAANATGDVAIKIEGPEDIAQFWDSKSVYYTTRYSWTRKGERDDKSYAKQQYMRLALGAMPIDSDYSLAIVVNGKLAG